MKKSLWKSARLSTVFALTMPLIAIANHNETEATDDAETFPVREDMALVSLEATVVAIDYELRDVTIEGPGGNIFTVTADPQVDRLDEISIGDTVSVNYLKSLAFELREPTAEELAEPLVVLDETVRAPEDMAPGVGQLKVIRAVCSIEGLDRQTMTAKLLGPLGNYNIVDVADPENLTKVRIGDSVVVTYTEALAIMLEKAEEDEEDHPEHPEHPEQSEHPKQSEHPEHPKG